MFASGPLILTFAKCLPKRHANVRIGRLGPRRKSLAQCGLDRGRLPARCRISTWCCMSVTTGSRSTRQMVLPLGPAQPTGVTPEHQWPVYRDDGVFWRRLWRPISASRNLGPRVESYCLGRTDLRGHRLREPVGFGRQCLIIGSQVRALVCPLSFSRI
jgi:hypothetical protein